LPILLTKDRQRGFHKIEEPGDDCADAGEMIRTASVLQLGVRGDIRQWGEPRAFIWIDGLDLGSEHGGGSGSLCGNQVSLECARIALQVGWFVELRRVHEDGHDDIIPVGSHLFDEGKVPSVQRAHGWDKAAPLMGFEFSDGGEDIHVSQPRVMMSVLFCPPKPKELLRQVSRAASRFTLGT
jgi:hypothetical protein